MDISDKIMGIHRSTKPKRYGGTFHSVIPSLIPYTTSIQEVAFAVSKSLNSKFTKFPPLIFNAETTIASEYSGTISKITPLRPVLPHAPMLSVVFRCSPLNLIQAQKAQFHKSSKVLAAKIFL